MERVTAQQLREIRERNPGMGLFDAKRIADRINAKAAVERANTFEELKEVLIYLIERRW